MIAALIRRWELFWHAPMPAIRLEVFRQALLLSLFVYLLHRFMFAAEWLSAIGFHPSPAVDRFNAPQVPLLPAGWIAGFGGVMFGSLALAMIGRRGWLQRSATAILLLCVQYVSLVDPISAFTLNRIFVFTLVVLVLAPTPREPAPGEDGPTLPAWPVRLLQTNLLVHYFASGYCKAVQGDWLVASDVLWLQMQEVFMTDAAAYMVRTLPPWAFTAQQGLALGFELLAPVLLGVRRLRPLGIVMGIGMHIFIAINMRLLIYFSLQMMCFYLLFIDPGALRRAWQRWAR